MAERVCEHCGVDISDRRDDAKFCSGAHRQAAYRDRCSAQRRENGKTWGRAHERSLTRNSDARSAV